MDHSGLRFFKKKITQKNLNEVLSEYLCPGGLLINQPWNIDTCDIVQ